MKMKISNHGSIRTGLGIIVDFEAPLRPESKLQAVPQVLTVLLINGFGILLTLTTTFKLPFNMWIITACIIIYTFVFGAAYFLIKRPWKFILVITAIFFAICVLLRKILTEGMNQTMGWVGEVIAENGKGSAPFPLSAAAYETGIMTLFFIAFLFPLMLFLSYAVLRRPNLFLLLLIIAPVLEMTLFFNSQPSVFAFVLLILGIFSQLVLNQSVNQVRRGCLDVRDKRRHAGNLSLLTAVLAGILIAVFWLLVSETDYTRFLENSELYGKAEEEVKETLSFTYEEKSPPQGGIAGGHFSNTDQFSFKGETALMVEADSLRGSIYLKGYVGGDYSESGWKPLPEELTEKGRKLADALKVWGLPSEVISYDNGMMSQIFHGENRFIKVTKTDAAPHQYQYIPYFLEAGSAEKMRVDEQGLISADKADISAYSASYYDVLNYDNNLFLFNRQEIKKQLLGNLNLADGRISREQIEDYFEREEKYADFVHEAYTRLPEGLPRRLVNEFSVLNVNSLNIESIIKTVMGNLSGRALYTLTPGKTPEQQDYVDYFLYENRKGYCTHFASAAVVIFRILGISARYVEGYVVTIDDYTRAIRTDDGRYLMEIEDTHSHAWCEIYLDGFGWLPVEVTPGLVAADTGGSTPVGGESIEYETSEESRLNDISMEMPAIFNSPAEGGIDDNVDEEAAGGFLQGIPPLWLLVAFGVLLLFSLYTILLVMRRKEVKRRICKMQDKDSSLSCLSWYTYLRDALKLSAPKYLGNRGISHLAWAKEMEEKNLFDEGNFLAAIDVVQKAAYSQGEISREECEFVTGFIKKAAEKLYMGLTTGGKLKWKYIARLPVYTEIEERG